MQTHQGRLRELGTYVCICLTRDRCGDVAHRGLDIPCVIIALQLRINVSLNRPHDRTGRRPPGRPRNKWLDQSYETIPPVRLESSGGVLSTVDMVVQRRDGPRLLRELDDDDCEICAIMQ